MLVKAIFAGFGGQGVLSMGLSLAQAAMLEGKQVTYLPAYGAEVRGGTANCTVAVSDDEIASPVASSPDYVVAMNQPSVVRFHNQIRSGGVLCYNASLVEGGVTRDDVTTVAIPANRIAEELGNPRSANMVMLGAFTRQSQLVALETLVRGLEATLKSKRKLIQVNTAALEAGYTYGSTDRE